MKWIDLSRVASDSPLGERFRDVSAVIAKAVDHGYASFPLSLGHYFETWKKRAVVPRHKLAITMATVSPKPLDRAALAAAPG
jgi:hypothetical protein